MREEKRPEMSMVRPLILTILMLIVVLVSPSYIYISEGIDISAIVWFFIFEQNEPPRFFLTLEPNYLLNGFMKYVFLIIVYVYFTDRISLKKAVFLGILTEVVTYVSYNFGNLLYIIFPVPGFFPSIPSDVPFPLYLLVFLVLAFLKPRLIPKQNETSENWLE